MQSAIDTGNTQPVASDLPVFTSLPRPAAQGAQW